MNLHPEEERRINHAVFKNFKSWAGLWKTLLEDDGFNHLDFYGVGKDDKQAVVTFFNMPGLNHLPFWYIRKRAMEEMLEHFEMDKLLCIQYAIRQNSPAFQMSPQYEEAIAATNAMLDICPIKGF